MPQFSSFPALQVQGPDIQGALQRAEQLKGARTLNKLREFQMQSAQGEVQRQGQLSEIMPGVGAEAGLGPGAQEALGLDPSMLGELLKIPKAKRDEAKRQGEMIANLLMPVVNARSPLEQQQAYAMAVQQAQQAGMPMDNVPQTLDMEWVHSTLAKAGKLKEALDQTDVLSEEAEAQKIRIALATRKGGETPSLVKIAKAYREALKAEGKDVTMAAAMRWAKSSVNDTPQETWTKIYTSNRRDFTMDEPQARKIADEITTYVHGENFGQPEAGPVEGGAGLGAISPAKAATPPLASVTPLQGGLGPGETLPVPGRKPSLEGVKLPIGEGSIESMGIDGVMAMIYGNKELTQDEKDRLNARLKALGY
jgi:hypothetical protein